MLLFCKVHARPGHINLNGPPWSQPRGKLMVSQVNSHTNATRIGWHMWEIDLRFAPRLPLLQSACAPRPHQPQRSLPEPKTLLREICKATLAGALQYVKRLALVSPCLINKRRYCGQYVKRLALVSASRLYVMSLVSTRECCSSAKCMRAPATSTSTVPARASFLVVYVVYLVIYDLC